MSSRECKSTRASVTVAVTVAILLVSAVARAATGGAPLTIAHSGYLLDGADAPLSNATLSMEFRIYDQSGGGTLQWAGTCAPVQVVRGYYTVLLGSTACPGTMADPDTTLDTNDLPTTGARWLEVEVGGVTMSPRMAVATVPTAARALDSDTVKGEALITLHDASKLTGVAPAAVLGTGSTGLATVGTVTIGTWQGTKVADAYVDGAATWNAKLAAVAHDGTLEGDGTVGVATQLKVKLGTAAGTVAAGDDTRFGRWSGVSTGLDAAAARTSLGLVTVATTGAYANLSGTPTLSAVATDPTCGAGYIPVPATALPGGRVVPGFCVMKYEAKKDGSGAMSVVASDMPWVSITWTAAKAECVAAGKHLITEDEWLAIANNVANVDSNWTDGAVGGNGGKLFSGHNDNAPASALAAGLDTEGYSGETNTGGDQRRTLTLSNGSVVWDLAGNVWEWTDATIAIASRYHGGATAAWMTYNVTESSLAVATAVPAAKRPPSPWSATQGMGRYYDGYSTAGAYEGGAPDGCGPGYCASQAAFLRGGDWADATDAGVFTLNLNAGRAYSVADVGFRCAGP